MNANIQTITLDLTNSAFSAAQKVSVVQGDSGTRPVKAIITDNGVVRTDLFHESARLYISNAKGERPTYVEGISINGGIAEFSIPQSATLQPGIKNGELRLVDKDEKVLSSMSFIVEVASSQYDENALLATDDGDVLARMVEQARTSEEAAADSAEAAQKASQFAVSYSEEQSLTDEQKAQARNNINAVDASCVKSKITGGTDIPNGDGLVDFFVSKQNFLPEQKQIARDNIDAVSKDELNDAIANIGGGSAEVAELRSELEEAIGTQSTLSEPEEIEVPRIDEKYYFYKENDSYNGGLNDGSVTHSQCTELIPVTNGEIYYVTGQYGYMCALITEFDENKNYLSSVGVNPSGNKIATDYEYVVPSGVAYVGFSTRSVSAKALIVKKASVSNVKFANIKGDIESLKEAVLNLENNTSEEAIDKLQTEVENIKTWRIVGKNLYNPENDTFGGRADGGGNASLGLRQSEWIAVEPNSNYVLSNNYTSSGLTLSLAFKNTDETIVSIASYLQISAKGKYLITTSDNTAYLRFTTAIANHNDLMAENIMLEKGLDKTEYEPFKYILDYKNRLPKLMQPESIYPWLGKKMVVDGDSISHDYARNYWQFVASKILGMHLDTSVKSADDDAENGVYGCGWRGIGGSTIANETQAKINAGVTVTENPLGRSIVLRYQNLPDDADIVLIAGGSNDWAHGYVDIGDFDSTDDTTFNGALNILLPALKTKYPTVPVVIMTPIKRGSAQNATNKKGYTMEQFVDAMIAKCRQYGVYCLDMWATCPISPHIPKMLELLFRTDDDTHPNAEGHAVMGKTVAGFIRALN